MFEQHFITPYLLAKRWSMTAATLSQWRWNGKGPLFLKIGGKVLYRLTDVEHFESQNRRQNTAQNTTGYGPN